MLKCFGVFIDDFKTENIMPLNNYILRGLQCIKMTSPGVEPVVSELFCLLRWPMSVTGDHLLWL